MTEGQARRIERGYLILVGLYTLSASLIWGVNTLFLLDAGLTLFEAFLANAAFTAGMVIFEIPTGVVADTLGRRISFLTGLAVLLVGTLGYVGLAEVQAGLVPFVLVSIVLGLGFTFYSGAVEAWIVDALHASGYTDLLDPVFARGDQIAAGARLVGTVGGGLLGQLDLAFPYLVRGGLLVVTFLAAWGLMREIGFEPRALRLARVPSEMARVARAGLEHGWQEARVRWLMVVGFLQMGFVAWGFYAFQPYFLALLEQDAVWVAGVVAAVYFVSQGVGSAFSERLAPRVERRTTVLIGSGIVFTLAIMGVGLVSSFWPALAFVVVMALAQGVARPVRQAFLNDLVSSSERATVLSVDSLVSSAGGIGSQASLGGVAQARSLSGGFVLGGAVTGLAIPMLLLLRKIGGAVDARAGDQPPGTAPQLSTEGIPEP